MDEPLHRELADAWADRRLCPDLPGAKELHIHHLGGAMGRVPTGAAAFTDRSSPFIDNCIAGTPEPAQLAGEMEWARAARDAMAAYGSGRTYVNFTGLGAGDKAKLSCPPGIFSRLQSVKDRYDPTNVFRLNQNIAPSSAG